jgi:outer membrane protein assembly factor BamB
MALIFLSLFILTQSLPAQSGGPSAGRESGRLETPYIWRQALGGTIIGSPVAQAQSVVVALDGGSVNSYSSSGRPLWSFATRGRITPFITRSREGTTYVCRTNSIFMAVNRVGRELWRINLGTVISAPVVLGWDGRVFVPMANKISCYTAAGNPLWARGIEGKITAGPWLDQGGGILLCTEGGNVLRIDHFGRVVSRRLQSPPSLLLPIRRSGDNVSRNLTVLALFGSGDVQLIDFAVADSQPQVLPRLPSPPLAGVGRGENAAVVLSDGRVVLLDVDGKTLWTGDSHIRVQGRGSGGGAAGKEVEVVYDERGVYVLSVTGATGFSGDGRRVWFTELKNASGIPVLDDEGVLYSGGTDWILYAWQQEDRPLQRQQTLYGPAPEGSYGTGYPPTSSMAAIAEYLDDTELRDELEAIRREILVGRVGGNELEWVSFLMETAIGGVRLGVAYSPPKIAPARRIMALDLLSLIGSRETIPWLVRFLRRENDPLLKAAAARAIGRIGVDPDGFAIQAFMAAVTEGEPGINEHFFISVAAATGALCRFSGPPLSGTGTQILVLLSESVQRPAVQRQARRELQSLM